MKINMEWNDVESLVSVLEAYLKTRRYDVIVAIARGGYVPARLLADRLGIQKILVTEIHVYEGLCQVDLVLEGKGKRALVVDDTADSYTTMCLVLDRLEKLGFEAEGAVIAGKEIFDPEQMPYPIFIGYEVKEEDFAVFPWERFEHKNTTLVKRKQNGIPVFRSS